MNDWNNIFEKKLAKVNKIFDIEKVHNAPTDPSSVSKYYKINRIPYSIIYRGHDAIHLGITYGEIYDRKEDILEQARIVEKYLPKNATKVLELGTGRGINSGYLASKYSGIKFIGLDLKGGHTHYAQKKASKTNNFLVEIGDFHDLSRFEKETFDIVFVVEAICYSTDDKKIFNEVKRILKDNGLFIVIDAFSSKKNPTAIELIIKKGIEKGMAVPEFTHYNEFKEIAKKSGYSLIHEEDLSKYVMPSLKRVEKYANWFFSFPLPIQKFFVSIFPEEFNNNAISGYFMSDSVLSGLYKYMVFVFKKNN